MKFCNKCYWNNHQVKIISKMYEFSLKSRCLALSYILKLSSFIVKISVFESLNPHEQFIIWWNLVLGLDSIIKIDSGYSAVGIDLNSLTMNVFGAERLFAILFQVKNYFIPAIVKLQGHGTFERLYPCDWLIVRRYEASFDIFIVQDCHFKPEVLVKLSKRRIYVFDQEDEDGHLDF